MKIKNTLSKNVGFLKRFRGSHVADQEALLWIAFLRIIAYSVSYFGDSHHNLEINNFEVMVAVTEIICYVQASSVTTFSPAMRPNTMHSRMLPPP